MPTLTEVEKWPGIMQVSRQYGLHPNSFYAWCRGQKFEALLLCGQWRINPRSLAKFLEARKNRRRKTRVGAGVIEGQ